MSPPRDQGAQDAESRGGGAFEVEVSSRAAERDVVGMCRYIPLSTFNVVNICACASKNLT